MNAISELRSILSYVIRHFSDNIGLNYSCTHVTLLLFQNNDMFMSKTEKIHPDYTHFKEMLDNLGVWDNPDKVEEATTRKYIESEIVEYAFDGDSNVKYGRNVDESTIEPKMFQSTEKVEVERVDTDDKGSAFKINAKISNLDPNNKINMFFDGFITELDGFVEEKPIIVRQS